MHYRDRFPHQKEAGHFSRAQHVPGAGELWMSSIGLGTYLGEPDAATDEKYVESISSAVRSGVNVLDTAINYRYQRSERNVGTALTRMVEGGEIERAEVVLCTKAGYLSFDGVKPADARGYFTSEYIEPGILDPKELAGGMHCMAPVYLEDQIRRSRGNLGVETIDVFYIHNPESQLGDVPRDLFHRRLKEAFAVLEKQVKARKICYYGVATWNGFRVPDSSRDYLGLAELASLAEDVGGERHHFRFVQLPFNLAMPEAYGLANQRYHKEKMSLLSAAARFGIAVMGSATLYQGNLTHGLPPVVSKVLGLKSDAENAIQFSRSTPGLACSLIGMGRKAHVEANLRPTMVPPTPEDEWKKLFTEH